MYSCNTKYCEILGFCYPLDIKGNALDSAPFISSDKTRRYAMKIAILGSGAREHALAWVLSGTNSIWTLPGNAGTVQLGTNVDIDSENVDAVVAFAKSQKIDLVVVGPEDPLAKGVVDRLARAGIPAFGPTQAAAQVEASKSSALDLMREAHIPHPHSWVFANPQAVCTFVRGYGKPIVVKADGLARGKGVWVCETYEEAARAAALCADFYPGTTVVQELLSGREVSVFGFTDGYYLSKLVAACDYKRRDDGDKGPNTGGMGSYAWPEFWNEELAFWVAARVMKPAIRAMALRKTPFSGVLYAGLMLTEDGPKVLEFNCRWGDPEAQVILPLFKGNLADVMLGCVRGTLSSETAEWDKERSCVGVVIASDGYPEQAVPDATVDGLAAMDPEILAFRGSNPGRIMTVVSSAPTVSGARDRLYRNLGLLHLEKAFFRTDIGRM